MVIVGHSLGGSCFRVLSLDSGDELCLDCSLAGFCKVSSVDIQLVLLIYAWLLRSMCGSLQVQEDRWPGVLMP